MTVYCEDIECKHNKDGVCENRFDTGQEAIILVGTIGGQVICSDQADEELEG